MQNKELQQLSKLYRTIAEKIADDIKGLGTIQTFLIIGSVAGGYPDEYSNVDLLALYRQEPTQKEIEKVFGSERVKGFRLEGSKLHVHLDVDHLQSTILFLPFEYVRLMVLKYPNVDYEEYQELFTYVAQTDVLFDKSRIFSFWKKTCSVFPSKLKRKVVFDRLSWLRFLLFEDDLINEARRGEWIFVNNRIQRAVESMVTIIYTLNDEVFINLKRSDIRLMNMKKKPKNSVERLTNLSFAKNTIEDFESKQREAQEMVKELEALV